MFKVLIVEDHASMRESLTTALEAAGVLPWWVKCQTPTMPSISAGTCTRTWC